jgi:hypothetical protein
MILFSEGYGVATLWIFIITILLSKLLIGLFAWFRLINHGAMTFLHLLSYFV